jgi:hypothetical protein
MYESARAVLDLDTRIGWLLRFYDLRVPSFVGRSVTGSGKHVLERLDSLAWDYGLNGLGSIFLVRI